MEMILEQIRAVAEMPGSLYVALFCVLPFFFMALVDMLSAASNSILFKFQQIRCRALHEGAQEGTCHCSRCAYDTQCKFFRKYTPFRDFLRKLSRRWKKDKP